jgi:hypothetical protein
MRRIHIALTVLLAVGMIATAAAALTITTDFPNSAPGGTHVQSGTITCTVSGLTVTCGGFELAGVGNANASALLVATYTATINCENNGGKIVAVKTGTFTAPSQSDTLSPENGRLLVPSTNATAPTEAEFLEQQTCPNPNWTPELAGGITLSTFTYTLTFVGFTTNAITITGP